MILTVCLSPCLDITIEVDALEVGKTNVVRRKRIRAGGKALNVALGVARLGEAAFLTGFTYRQGKEVLEALLRENNVAFDYVENEGSVRENYKFIDHRSMLTEVNDVGAEVSAQSCSALLQKVSEYAAHCDAVVVSGGLPRGVSHSFYGDIFRAVPDGCLKIADATEGKLYAALSAGVDLVKPNLAELQLTVGRELPTAEEQLAACRELIDLGTKYVLLSLGKKGAILTDGKESYQCKNAFVAVNSTVGAGDAMVAAATCALRRGECMQEILKAGVAAGSAAVSTFEENSFSYAKYLEIYNGLQVVRL